MNRNCKDCDFVIDSKVCELCREPSIDDGMGIDEEQIRADEREKAFDEFANWYRSRGYSAYDIGLLIREYKKEQIKSHKTKEEQKCIVETMAKYDSSTIVK